MCVCVCVSITLIHIGMLLFYFLIVHSSVCPLVHCSKISTFKFLIIYCCSPFMTLYSVLPTLLMIIVVDKWYVWLLSCCWPGYIVVVHWYLLDMLLFVCSIIVNSCSLLMCAFCYIVSVCVCVCVHSPFTSVSGCVIPVSMLVCVVVVVQYSGYGEVMGLFGLLLLVVLVCCCCSVMVYCSLFIIILLLPRLLLLLFCSVLCWILHSTIYLIYGPVPLFLLCCCSDCCCCSIVVCSITFWYCCILKLLFVTDDWLLFILRSC